MVAPVEQMVSTKYDIYGHGKEPHPRRGGAPKKKQKITQEFLVYELSTITVLFAKIQRDFLIRLHHQRPAASFKTEERTERKEARIWFGGKDFFMAKTERP